MTPDKEIARLQAEKLRLYRIVRRLAHMLQYEDMAKANMPGRSSCIYHDAGWFIDLAERLVDQMHGRRNETDREKPRRTMVTPEAKDDA